jgi:hypothetical protein
MSFSDSREGSEPQLLSLPSKRVSMYTPPGGTLIARSDTNGEDLEAFAGAGLYDRWGMCCVPCQRLAMRRELDSAVQVLFAGSIL